MNTRILSVLSLFTLGLVLTGCGNSTPEEEARMELQVPTTTVEMTISEALQDDAQFAMLWTAIRAAGMADSWEEGRKYTIFAPSNAAFGKIPGQELQNLLTDRKSLRPLLEEHILGYGYDTNNFQNEKVRSLGGKDLTITGGETASVEGIRVLSAIEATNGYIYTIGDVIGNQSMSDDTMADEKKNETN